MSTRVGVRADYLNLSFMFEKRPYLTQGDLSPTDHHTFLASDVQKDRIVGRRLNTFFHTKYLTLTFLNSFVLNSNT